jgi:hypothetical protein
MQDWCVRKTRLIFTGSYWLQAVWTPDVGNQLVDRLCRLLLPLQGLQGSEKSKVKYIAVWRIRRLPPSAGSSNRVGAQTMYQST